MKFIITSPSRANVTFGPNDDPHALHQALTFTNTSVAHEIKRHYNNFWARSKNRKQWEYVLSELQKRSKRTLVFTDELGTYIRPGSIPYLAHFNPVIENQVEYPVPKKIAWKSPPPFTLYPYQQESWKKLLDIKHGNVELCTGAGKSNIILQLCRESGFRTAIVAPSKSIFEELLEKFQFHFGKNTVGTYGAGKKKLDRRFTVCISDSITNVKPNTEEWNFFSNLDCVIVDESHTFGAETLEHICYGVLNNIPYRFFLSGTQTRNDGAEMLLQSIIGQTVHTLSTKEAVDGSYICPHEYRIVELESSNPNYSTQDALEAKRVHYLKNKNIASFVAKLANAEGLVKQRQTLILVEELEQISMLLPLMRVPVAIAHSEKKLERLLTLNISKVNPSESVEKFNKGEALVLIGTSCISTGTNIFPVHNCVNWQGGSSPIKTKQGAVGRAIRLGKHNPWADKCQPKDKAIIWDFRVGDIEIMVKHLQERLSCYQESGSQILTVKLKR